MVYTMAISDSPKAKATPALPTCPPAITAVPTPAKTSTNVPNISAAYFILFLSLPRSSWRGLRPLRLKFQTSAVILHGVLTIPKTVRKGMTQNCQDIELPKLPALANNPKWLSSCKFGFFGTLWQSLTICLKGMALLVSTPISSRLYILLLESNLGSAIKLL